MKLFAVELRFSLQIEHEMTLVLTQPYLGTRLNEDTQVFDRQPDVETMVCQEAMIGLTSHEQRPSIPLSHDTGWLMGTCTSSYI